jgi:DNA-binding CsgD family transcriptional regulator
MSYQELSQGFPADIIDDVMAKVLNKINAYICIIDASDLRLLWANRYFLNNIEYSPKVLLNMNPNDLLRFVHPDCREALLKSLTNINISNHECQVGFYNIMIKWKQWIWVLATISLYERNCHDGPTDKLLLYATKTDINQLYDQLKHLVDQAKGKDGPKLLNLLSVKEKKVIEHISNGESDREISEKLEISIHTARTHRKKIIHKLGLKNSCLLVKFAIENGLG